MFIVLKMAIDQSMRKLIKSDYEQGKNPNKIYFLLNKLVSRKTIYNIVTKIKNGQSLQSIKPPGRPRTKRTKKFIKNVKKKLLNNKKRKTPQQIANELDCSKELVRLTIRDDLQLKPFKKIVVPSLTEDQKAKRLNFARWVRKNFNDFHVEKSCFQTRKCLIQMVKSTHKTTLCMPIAEKKPMRWVVFIQSTSFRSK